MFLAVILVPELFRKLRETPGNNFHLVWQATIAIIMEDPVCLDPICLDLATGRLPGRFFDFQKQQIVSKNLEIR